MSNRLTLAGMVKSELPLVESQRLKQGRMPSLGYIPPETRIYNSHLRFIALCGIYFLNRVIAVLLDECFTDGTSRVVGKNPSWHSVKKCVMMNKVAVSQLSNLLNESQVGLARCRVKRIPTAF